MGDAAFKKISLEKIRSLADEGRTVLFVSHLMDGVKNLCPRVIVLRLGKVVADDRPELAIEA